MVAVILPCFNENDTVIDFLGQLERALQDENETFTVIVVNDSSTDNTLELLRRFEFRADNLDLRILNLRFNVGHQGAIYQGLLYARDNLKAEDYTNYIVMDSDGEDDPAAIPELLRYREHELVHVKRGKRNEGIGFRFFYGIYKLLFRIVTGKKMNFGNYCLFNRKVLEAAAYNSFIHFPASLLRLRVNRTYVVSDRKKRIAGKSKMSISKLVLHAFKSFVEYAEELLMVFLKQFILVSLLIIAVIVYVVYEKFVRDAAVLGWTSTILLILIGIALLSIGFFVLGVLLLNLLSKRSGTTENRIYSEVE